MALIACKKCGAMVSDKADACSVCGTPLHAPEVAAQPAPTPNGERKENEEKKVSATPSGACPPPPLAGTQKASAKGLDSVAENTSPCRGEDLSLGGKREGFVREADAPTPPPVSAPPSPRTTDEGAKKRMLWIGIAAGLLALFIGVAGFFYYRNVYLPEKIDREAPRYYTLADAVVLRSSQSSGADYNKIGTLPYGTELITYEYDDQWSRVKVNSPSASGEQAEGFVSSPFILSKHDFFLLNSIFGDADSRQTVATAKCRRALLNYYKEKQYIGRLDDPDLRMQAGISITPGDENQWQVFSRPANTKPNSVFFPRLINRNSKFTDFAVLIQNLSNGQRKLLYFYFDDDETPHLASEQAAPPTGFIRNIEIRTGDGGDYLHVDYSE